MQQTLLSKIVVKIFIALLFVGLIDLAFLNFVVIEQNEKITAREKADTQNNREVNLIPEKNIVAEKEKTAKEDVESETSTKSASVVKVENTTYETKTIIQTAQKEIFIPIGSSQTNSNNYVDLAGLEVSVDSSKYTNVESVVFEGSFWVQDGNGKMQAQLFNKTDKHPVWNSEISTNSASGKIITSPKITLDSGIKSYQVQAKTDLVDFAAHVDNARLKITLK